MDNFWLLPSWRLQEKGDMNASQNIKYLTLSFDLTCMSHDIRELLQTMHVTCMSSKYLGPSLHAGVLFQVVHLLLIALVTHKHVQGCQNSFCFCILLLIYLALFCTLDHILWPLFIISLICLLKKISPLIYFCSLMSPFQSQNYMSNGLSKYQVHSCLPLCLPI